MKKIFCLLTAICFLVVSVSFFACATEDFEKEISESLFSALNEEVVEALKSFGITDFDFDSIYSVSIESVFNYYCTNLPELLSGSVKMFFEAFAIISFFGIVSMLLQEKKYKRFFSALSVMSASLFIVEEINLCLSSALSLLKLNSTFMVSFVPVYAVTVAVSGNPSAALTYNSMLLVLSEIISALINYGIIDLLGCYFCLCIAFSVNDSFGFSKIIGFVNRAATFILGFASSLFASVLAVKGSFAASADSVASRSLKFTIGSLIPIIGSSLSEAYSTVVGSINIIKGSVAIIGIIAVLIMNLPVIIEIVFNYFSLSCLGFICELLDCQEMSQLFKGVSSGIKIIGLLIIFEMMLLIISTALMLSFKGG